MKQRSKREEWKGFRFVFISLAVTTVSIIFFFAAKPFFFNIVLRGFASIEKMTQDIMEWGDVRLKGIDFRVVDAYGNGEVEELQPFLIMANQLKNELKSFEGTPFWLVDLVELKMKILNQAWVSSVSLQREFPASLQIDVTPHRPVMLMHAPRAWVAMNAEGKAVWNSKQIPGSWSHLPLIYGMEETVGMIGDLAELNRRFQAEEETLIDLQKFLVAAKEKLGIFVESVRIAQDDWAGKSMYVVQFDTEPARILGLEGIQQKLVEISVVSMNWESRIEHLQYILSDLRQRKIGSAKIMGQFDGRWIVQPTYVGAAR